MKQSSRTRAPVFFFFFFCFVFSFTRWHSQSSFLSFELALRVCVCFFFLLLLIGVGETGHYCPVTLRRQQWLLPGRPEYPVYIHQKVYFCHDEKTMNLFSIHPAEFIPSSYLVSEAEEEEEEDLQSQVRMYREGKPSGALYPSSSSSSSRVFEGAESPRERSDFYLGIAASDEQINQFKSSTRKDVYTPPPR